jgi:hypothetical protein
MDFLKFALWLVDLICGRRIDRQAREHLAGMAQAQARATRERSLALLARLGAEPGPHVLLGETAWHEPVRVPLAYLANAHSIITGGTGAGKTLSVMALVESLLEAEDTAVSFGVLDAKGELFDRTLYLIARRLAELPPARADALRERLVIVDLACPDPVTSYNIACPWVGSDRSYFVATRVENLQELLPAGDGFSLRGGSIVKHMLLLLAEHNLPFSYFDRALSSDVFRAKLLARSPDEDLRYYFKQHFPGEGRATIGAVRARLNAALLSSASLKLALSGTTAPDFRALQDDRKIVLINCAGPNIARATARTLQALFLSDIRQAVFSRQGRTPYLWICDEAQNFFRTKALRENMTDLLTMSRSFGSFFLYLTQNLSTAVQERDMLETLYTNIRWSLTMRGTTQDAAFLRAALPVTGRRQKPRVNPYLPVEFYKPAEERELVMQEIAHLPDFQGWLWLKSLSGEAIKIRTRFPQIPMGVPFQEAVNRIRRNARIGYRVSRGACLEQVARRDAEWLPQEGPNEIDKGLKN